MHTLLLLEQITTIMLQVYCNWKNTVDLKAHPQLVVEPLDAVECPSKAQARPCLAALALIYLLSHGSGKADRKLHQSC